MNVDGHNNNNNNNLSYVQIKVLRANNRICCRSKNKMIGLQFVCVKIKNWKQTHENFSLTYSVFIKKR